MKQALFTTGLLLATWITATLAEPLPVRFELKSGQKFEAEILHRDGKQWVFVRQTGQDGEIGVAVPDVVKAEFAIDLRTTKIEALYDAGQYDKTAEALAPLLKPVFPYTDLPGNAAPLVDLYTRCLYWTDQYEATITTAHLLDRAADEPTRRAARVYRALAMIGLKWTDKAAAELKGVGKVEPRDEVGAMYHYALAVTELAAQNWDGARENAGRVIAFHAKNFDWLAPALYVSAQACVGEGKPEVALQILQELNMVAPRSRANQQSAELRRKLESAAAVKAAAEKAAAEKADQTNETNTAKSP